MVTKLNQVQIAKAAGDYGSRKNWWGVLEEAIEDHSYVGSTACVEVFAEGSKWLNINSDLRDTPEYNRIAAAVTGYGELIPKDEKK